MLNTHQPSFMQDTNPIVDTFPGILAPQIPIIVAGAVQESGIVSDFSQGGSSVTVWAPGQMLQCASHSGDGNVRVSGTSLSVGMVAGLAAYLMSTPEYSNQVATGGIYQAPFVKKLITDKAYPRAQGGHPVVYNGVDWVNGCGKILSFAEHPKLSAEH